MQIFLLKGDVSGIQRFIFDTPTKGAAKTLKGRSLWVNALTEQCLDRFKQSFPSANVLYSGGGNFFVRVTADAAALDAAIWSMQQDYLARDLFPVLAYVPETGSLGQTMTTLSSAVQRAKLRRPVSLVPFAAKPIQLPELSLPLGVNGHVPRNARGEVLDFDHVVRTGPGVDKLAALKIDVDKLGDLFRDRAETDYQTLSNSLTRFFSEKLLQLIQSSGGGNQVYVVFAGGDDCFLIGRWNVLFTIAGTIEQAFRQFQGQLRQTVGGIAADITLSAGLIVVTPTYPMVRLAEDAEAALHTAKTGGRNRVSVFGQVLTWNEFDVARNVASQLQNLIDNKGESRGVLEFVKNSEIGFSRLQQKARTGSVTLPKVWRLKYYLRNVRPANRPEMEGIFKNYETALIQSFMNPKAATNPAVFPVAARWAELLTRSNDSEPQTNNIV